MRAEVDMLFFFVELLIILAASQPATAATVALFVHPKARATPPPTGEPHAPSSAHYLYSSLS